MEKFVRTQSINNMLSDTPSALIETAEENYEAYIREAAERITAETKKPVVLLAGPSGSGKTTTAMRIGKCIQELGHGVKILSMDNYFLPVTPENEGTLPRDEKGSIDLESPHRLDIPLFSEHLEKLGAGEEFMMPVFDFPTQSRPRSVPFCRQRDEIIIIEGIHALNPIVTGNADKYAQRVYVSVRTRLKAPDGSLLHPRHIRLMRRLCRDRLFRKREYKEIFSMFAGVSRGEDLFIYPFKHLADIDIDTFMAYEPSVYKPIIERELSLVEDISELEVFPEYAGIVKFLGELSPADSGYVPADSLIREFIGGSEFEY